MSDQPEAGSPAHVALARLAQYLERLRLHADAPSAQEISRRLGTGVLSKSTIATMLNGTKLSTWANVAKVVDLLGGDKREALSLWEQADAARPASITEPRIRPCTPDMLGVNCVLPLAVDDQWVPRSLLRRMADQRLAVSDIAAERDRLLHGELVRSLICARRIVINRSYLVRNPVLSKAYRDDSADREAFTKLLDNRDIVPYLYLESSPRESDPDLEPVAREAAEVWNDILRSTAVMCVRLSWDENANVEATTELQQKFVTGVQRAAARSDLGLLLEDVGVSAEDADEFQEQLGHVPLLTEPAAADGEPAPGKPVSRTTLYDQYIMRPGTKISSGHYDFTKPNMVPLKWVFDLVYNSNLASALGIALTTPVDSAHRSVLHGSDNEALRVRITLQETIQHMLFSHDFSTGALDLFARQSIANVVRIRTNDVWVRYARSVETLLRKPWLLSHPERGLPNVYGRYQDLIRYIEGLS